MQLQKPVRISELSFYSFVASSALFLQTTLFTLLNKCQQSQEVDARDMFKSESV